VAPWFVPLLFASAKAEPIAGDDYARRYIPNLGTEFGHSILPSMAPAPKQIRDREQG
jgi:hypothetical protein